MVSFLPADRPIKNADFAKALAMIHHQRRLLHLPEISFGAVLLKANSFSVVAAGTEFDSLPSTNPMEALLDWLKQFQNEGNYKLVSVFVTSEHESISTEQVGSRLWLECNIVPFLALNQTEPSDSNLTDLAAQTSVHFDKQGVVDLNLTDRNEVLPSFLFSLTDYKDYSQSLTTEKEWTELRELGKDFQGKKLLFISATPRGGGVALMRHALIRLFRLMDVDAKWHVMTEHADVFQITKGKFHNVLQGVSDPSIKLSDEDIVLYERWSKENAEILAPVIQEADVIVIDDCQPAGLIPHIKQKNPEARLLYRSHIQIDSAKIENAESPQAITWNFLWKSIQMADAFIAHPIPSFVPQTVPPEKLVYMPPTTDPLDGLNKPLDQSEQEYYLGLFNQKLVQDYQTALDTERPYLIQVARFDPSKGIPDVIESYRLLREKFNAENISEIPQLVVVGHGSVDDPDGAPLLHLTKHMLTLPLYRAIAADIKVALIPHIDQLLNALLRSSLLALQLSHKEGFEIKVTEALLKGKPVVSYRAGGIPLQIENNVNGFIIEEIGDTAGVAEKLFQLLTDTKLYEQMSQAAKEQARRDVLTAPNAIKWLKLALNRFDAN
jgi:glycosyltransferase involved in cell wall biosynthesis